MFVCVFVFGACAFVRVRVDTFARFCWFIVCLFVRLVLVFVLLVVACPV